MPTARQDAEAFKKCFDYYCDWFDHEANFEKSSLFFSKNIIRIEKRSVFLVTGFNEMGNFSIYLVNSLAMGMDFSKELGLLKDKV